MTRAPRVRMPTVAELRMEMVARVSAGAALVVVVASFAYSFAQIKWVADQLGGEPAWLAYAFPFIIDLPALVASALTVALHDRPMRQRAYAWTILIFFTALSWLANAVHALQHATLLETVPGNLGIALVIALAGFPPVGVVLGMHIWAYALRHSARAEEHVRTVETRTTTTTAPVLARPAAPARTTTAEPARTSAPTDARTDAPTSALGRTLDVAGIPVRRQNHEAAVAVRAQYEQAALATPGVKPAANRLADLAGVTAEQVHPAQVRKWVACWWTIDTGTPDADLTITVDSSDTRAA